MWQLPDDVRVLALTQRGHGDSERPQGDHGSGYAVADLAADAAAFLDAMEVEDACVVGHSMGSFVAQELALSYPERVSSLVLVGSAHVPSNPVVRALHAEVQALQDPIDRGFVHGFQASTLHRPIPDHVLEEIVDESMKMPARVWKAALAGLLAYDASERLRSLSMPVLIAWGDKDSVFDRQAQDELVSRIPHARLSIYRDTGHGLHWEQPAEFARDLVTFLEGFPVGAVG
jgi:pimeloyl-ACP methyl ester carboxylesterase